MNCINVTFQMWIKKNLHVKPGIAKPYKANRK